MTASALGLVIPGTSSATTTFTALTDGRVIKVTQTGGSYFAQFYAADGTLLGAPVNVTASIPTIDLTQHGVTNYNPQVVAQAGGGFALLVESSDGNTATDYVATFDSQARILSGYKPVEQSAPAAIVGSHALIALANGGYYVAWDSNASASVLFNPLLAGAPAGTLGNYATENVDAYGAVFDASGNRTALYTLDAGTLTAPGGYTYPGLAFNQLADKPAQLGSGVVVQPFQDTVFYVVYAGGYSLAPELSVSVSLNGGPRTIIYTPTIDSRANLTSDPVDLYANLPSITLTNGTAVVFYGTQHNTPQSSTFISHAAFLGADGSVAGTAQVLTRTGLNGSGSYADDPISAVALPSGGFALAYIAHPAGGAPSSALQVSLFDASGVTTQTVTVPVAYTGGFVEPPTLALGPDGTLFVEDGLNQNIYAVVGTAPGDAVVDGRADTATETLTGTSATRNYVYAGSGATTINGGAGTNILHGGSGLDLINGGPGADAITAGSGGGTISGGGGADTVSFTGALSAYTVAQNGSATLVTTLATGAVQTITGVTTLQFAERALSLPLVSLPDLSGVLSTLALATLRGALSTLAPTGLLAQVPTVAGGGASIPAATGGGLNALVVAPAAGGTATTLPGGYGAGYLLGAGGTLVDAGGNALLVGGAAVQTLVGAAGGVLVGDQSSTTFLPGAGAGTLVGGTGQNVFALAASTALVTSQGNDVIFGGSASATITASGTPLYYGSTGPALFTATAGASTLVGGGTETVNAVGGSMLLFGGTGPLTFNAGGATSTVVSGSGGAAVTGGAGATLYFGNGSTTYTPGAAVDTVIGFAGSLTATGGANGTLFFTGTAGNNMVGSGTGSATIIGFGTGDLLSATGAGNNVVAAAAAAETVNGGQSTGNNTFFAFGADDVLIGGAGQTGLESGLGNHTLMAGSGSTLFEILAGTPNRTITVGNFNAAQDFVQLQGYARDAGALALRTAAFAGGNETIALTDGTRITFLGVTGLTPTSFLPST